MPQAQERQASLVADVIIVARGIEEPVMPDN